MNIEELLSNIDINNLYIFGNINNTNIDLSTFKIIKQNERGIIAKANLSDYAYISFISLNKLLANNYSETRIILKYSHGNILAFINEKDIKNELKLSNEIYFVFTNEKKLSYCTIGLPIKPNELYFKRELDSVITNIKRFNTLIGSNRAEIDYTNTCFETIEDISF